MENEKRTENKRTTGLLAVRPTITAAYFSEETSREEKFQNETLRPILKLQQPLFVQLFKGYIKLKKNRYYIIPLEKQSTYLTEVLCSDARVRSELLGVVIGQFTLAELEIYQQNINAFNRRIMNMLKERILSSKTAFSM